MSQNRIARVGTAMAKKKGHAQQHQEKQQGDDPSSRSQEQEHPTLTQPIQQTYSLLLQQQQPHAASPRQEVSTAAASIASLSQFDQALQRGVETEGRPALFHFQNNNQGARLGSTNSLAASGAPMNFSHPGTTALDGRLVAGGTAATERELLSAILSEGISSTGRAPFSLQSLEALQRSAPIEPPQALSTVNRALQEQLLMSELLVRNPSTQHSSSQAVPLNLLTSAPIPPLHGFQNQTPRLRTSYTNPQQRLIAPSATEIRMLPPRSVDLLRSQPNTSVSTIGTRSGLINVGTSCIGRSEEAELKSESEDACGGASENLKRGVLKTGDDGNLPEDQQNSGTLPPRKRRKTVNFKLESSETMSLSTNEERRHHHKASFPLPSETEQGLNNRFKFDASRALPAYKVLWENLGRAKRGRKEIFRRCLQRGKRLVINKKT